MCVSGCSELWSVCIRMFRAVECVHQDVRAVECVHQDVRAVECVVQDV